ncbi:MAG: putative bifunctional diguanylate cyclase/phosphodiesterase [Acidimicrobiales bacterium]
MNLGPRPDDDQRGTLTTRLVGHLSGALWMLCGALVMAAGSFVPLPSQASRLGVLITGVGAVACGTVIWKLPWQRWGRTSTLWVVPLAFAVIALDNRFMGGDGFVYAVFYLVAFVWIGLAHPPGTALRFLPLLAVSYLVPLINLGATRTSLGVGSAFYVLPSCALVGETVAWVGNRLNRSEAALADAEERFRGSFEHAPIGMALASCDGHLIRVNQAFSDILGRQPDDLAGMPIRQLTHRDDWETTASEMQSLSAGEIESYQLEKRYIRADGATVWVSVSSSCVRDGAGNPSYMIGQIEDITERREMRERLAHDAVHDLLTGLPNRALFMDRIQNALQRTQRGGRPVALFFLDLDRFKLINDSLGHEVGDRLLQTVAHRLSRALRGADTLARFGGDEFTALCEVRDADEAMEVARRLTSSMGRPLASSDGEMFVSVSVGVALSTGGSESGPELLRNADVAMYRAKQAGPSHIVMYREDEESGTLRRLRTSNELHRALERQELELHYQPLAELHTCTMVGIEALVRWRHPTRGLLLPGEFIPLAEDSGLIVPLGAWVVAEACRQVARWDTERSPAGQDAARLNVSVNVSAQQIADPSFPDHVAVALADSGLNPDRLWLEITESTLMGHGELVIATLTSLRALGLHLEIDDFGTGYSSLSYLKRLPIETLKVDRSFIDEIDTNPEDVAIVRAIIALGESLGLSVVAEGVERRSQADELRALNCYLAQGFLYGRPLPASELGAFPTDDLARWAHATTDSLARPSPADPPVPSVLPLPVRLGQTGWPLGHHLFSGTP